MKNIFNYILGPKAKRNTNVGEISVARKEQGSLHPAVKYLDKKSYSVSARFRSLSSRPLGKNINKDSAKIA